MAQVGSPGAGGHGTGRECSPGAGGHGTGK